MILPIVAYGNSILKKRCEDVPLDRATITPLLNNMWETMYNARGVGLAAPQVGLNMRIFIVDTLQLENEEDGIKNAFINAEIIEEFDDLWTYEEGCLSIPKLTGDVERNGKVTIKYWDEEFNEHLKTFDGMNARVIQHEYDHIEGILFIEKLKPLKKRLIQRKLDNIKKGKIDVDYKMKFGKIHLR